MDPERNCVFSPSSDRSGLPIGRANEGDSYFSITLELAVDEDPGKICFRVGFVADPTVKARFRTAVFSATFGYDDDDGVHHDLIIRDLFPKNELGSASEVQFGAQTEGNIGLAVGAQHASVTGGTRMAKSAQYTRKTWSKATGQGQHSPTAFWTFEEDPGAAGQHGLDTQYDLFVRIPPTEALWIKCWGKAVLVEGRNKRELKLGSKEEPFERILSRDVS